MRPDLTTFLVLLAAGCGGAQVEVREAGPQARHAAHGEPEAEPEPEPEPGAPADLGQGLVREILEPGSGPAAATGRLVRFHYRSHLADTWGDEEAEPFDSSGPMPMETTLDSGEPRLIDGLTRGLAGLRAGSRALLRIPATLAWGAEGNPAAGVPEEADLVVELRVVEVR